MVETLRLAKVKTLNKIFLPKNKKICKYSSSDNIIDCYRNFIENSYLCNKTNNYKVPILIIIFIYKNNSINICCMI